MKNSRYSQEYLSLLARRGKIHAIKKGRDWYATEDDIENYEIMRNKKKLEKQWKESRESGLSDLSM